MNHRLWFKKNFIYDFVTRTKIPSLGVVRILSLVSSQGTPSAYGPHICWYLSIHAGWYSFPSFEPVIRFWSNGILIRSGVVVDVLIEFLRAFFLPLPQCSPFDREDCFLSGRPCRGVISIVLIFPGGMYWTRVFGRWPCKGWEFCDFRKPRFCDNF